MNVVVSPHPYSRAFDEVAETIRCGLDQLAATGFVLPDRDIIINAHTLPLNTRLDEQTIIYNFEQHDSPQLNEATLKLFRQHEVWDYSPSNVTWFAERGVKAKYVPIGYAPRLSRIEHAKDPDIDVLFYGLVNDRRRKILNELRAGGLNVCDAYALHGRAMYGAERDQLIARSKIVLNLHYYDTGIFEIVRCAYLFANAVCVVSETSIDVPDTLTRGVYFGKRTWVDPFTLASHETLIAHCTQLVKDPNARRRQGLAGHVAFRDRFLELFILQQALTT